MNAKSENRGCSPCAVDKIANRSIGVGFLLLSFALEFFCATNVTLVRFGIN